MACGTVPGLPPFQLLAVPSVSSEHLDSLTSALQWAKYLRLEVEVGPSRFFYPKEDLLPTAKK